jgi:hypothetical protein
VIYFISAVFGGCEETQACFSEEVLTSLFIIFLQRSCVRTSLPVRKSLSTSFGVSVALHLFRGSRLWSKVLNFGHSENLSCFDSRLSTVP